MGISVLERNYHPPHGVFDEMMDADGSVRPQWREFLSHLDALGSDELRRRWQQGLRLIHENGVTYNVYGDPEGMDRPWQLDPVPLLFDSKQWAELERGLAQRARLLELILEDIYGPQRLLAEGLLPPELVFANPAYWRPCHGLAVAGRRLAHYAADIGRGSDGRLWVLGDRTQTPSGSGYALENRLVVSRALPDVFRDCQVQRLAGFFRSMRETFRAMAPHNRDNPRIVLLTPGPYNETYFEHAYLARYLGYTLVEGADLTVRDQTVYLKTLGGLQQVDVIVRRLDDNFCDPLELQPDSALGVPGLVQAARAGNVAVANALGVGAVDAHALQPFFPKLCQRLLGEDPILGAPRTIWCGHDEGLAEVQANLEHLVIKPAFRQRHATPVFGEELTADQRAQWRARIQANPAAWVGQEKAELSTAPVLIDDRFEPRHVVLRAHVVAAGESYAIMPGGLVRFSGRTDSMIVSMQRGGGSKDAWVLSSGPVDTFSLLQPPGAAVILTRAGGDLPSRVADNLFWLGRYMERAEALARLARAILVRILDQNRESDEDVSILLAALPTPPKTDRNNAHTVLKTVLLDPACPAGLASDLADIHRIARVVRDRISIDTWRILARFAAGLLPEDQKDAPVDLNDLLAGLDRLILWFAAFGGLAMESMTRGHAWRFQDMGRRLERATHTTALLRTALVPPTNREAPLLEAVLEIADSSMTYRRRYMTGLQAAPVLDLLLADETNPRSVAFQLDRMMEHIEELPHATATAGRSSEERLTLRSLTDLRLLDTAAEAAPDASGRRVLLDNLLARTHHQLEAISESLSQSYLSHALVSRQLGAAVSES